MNLFAHNTGRESIKTQATPEPYVARRAVRYAAADNAQAALQRQFPGMSFGHQAVSHTVTQQQQTPINVGVPDELTQAS
ncbi:MAG: hypothetical protein ACQR33_05460 [Candidatus Saccharibacteria bacterium]